MNGTEVRVRETHQLDIGVTVEGSLTHVHCIYPGSTKLGTKPVKVFGKTPVQHPATHLSVSLQEDIIWTSHQPFKIDLKDEKVAKFLFFRPLPWYSIDDNAGSHRVHSGALDPGALPLVQVATNQQIELKFTVTQLESTNGPRKKGVEILDPHIIIEP